MAVQNQAGSRRRTPRLLGAVVVGIVAAAGVLTACGTNNNEVAASVDSNTVTLTQFESAVQAGVNDPVVGKQVSAHLAAYRVQVLSVLFQEQIIDRIASNAGIVVTDAEVDKFAVAAGGGTLKDLQKSYLTNGDPFTIRELRSLIKQEYVEGLLAQTKSKTSMADQIAAAEKAITATGRTYDISVLTFSAQADADTAYNSLKAGSTTMAAIGAQLGADTNGNPQPSTQAGFEPSQLDPTIQAQFAAGTEGGYLDFTINGGFFVVQLTKITPPATGADLTAQATTQVQQTLATSGATLAEAQAKTFKLYVNPRFGKLSVVSGSLPSVADGTPSTFELPGAQTAAVSTTPAVPAGS